MKDTYRGFWHVAGRNVPDPPFVLNVVAPSGRRPWPVETEGTHEYVGGEPIEVMFSYPVVYVPTGKRARIQSRVWDKTPVLFRDAPSSELQTACRIHWKEDSAPTEIVFFENELWWSQPHKLTMPHLVVALSAGKHAAVGLLDPGSVAAIKPADSISALKARKIVRDGREDCVANLNRGASQVLVSDGRIYIREGAPLYSLWDGYHNQSITSVGTSAVVVELCSSRRNTAFEDVSNSLIFGRLFEVSDRTGVEDFARSRKAGVDEMARIEILRPELLRQDPVKAQLEATLRKLLRLLSIHRAGIEAGGVAIMAERRRLSDAAASGSSTIACGQALKEFLDWTSAGRQPWKTKLRVETLFIRDAIDRIDAECRRRGQPSPFPTGCLNPEEDVAVGTLSDTSGSGFGCP